VGKQKLAALAAAVATVLVGAGGALAVTGGTVDAADQNVGALIGVAPSGAEQLFCSGTLIAPTVFLTAAHCIQNIESLPGARVAVTFDTTFDPGTSKLIFGTPVISPYFSSSQNDPEDLAVVLLDSAPRGIKPVSVVRQTGYLDTLPLADATFENVGYGVSNPVNAPKGPTVEGAGTRRASYSSFNSLTKGLLKLKQNQSFGGTCTGDSGGPQFLNGLEVSLTITGDTQCKATNVDQRLDTPLAQAFLAPYLAKV
jgi:secreted trypsin-like serine protease